MNWPAVVAELQSLGMTQAQIAAACSRKQAAVSELARGVTADPSYSFGEALRSLLSEKRQEAARISQLASAPAPGTVMREAA